MTRRGLALAVALVGVVALAACGDDDSGDAPSNGTSATPPLTLPASEPCGGAATVEAAVRAGLVGVPADDVVVSNVRVATADPTWAAANSGPSGPDASYQGGLSVLQCQDDVWVEVAGGTGDEVCPAIPEAVAAELCEGAT